MRKLPLPTILGLLIFGFGAIATTIMQSSSLVSVITISFHTAKRRGSQFSTVLVGTAFEVHIKQRPSKA